MENEKKRWCANDVEPSYLIHPGEIILDEIKYLKISQKRLADCLGIPRSQLNEILHGKRPVSPEIALMVQAALGISAQALLNMQMAYDIRIAKRDKTFLERLQRIVPFAAASL